MPVPPRIRDEFRLYRVFPRHHDTVRFYTTPWLTNQVPFLVYRLLLCVYNVSVLVVYVKGGEWAWNPKVLITLTYQTYILWTVYSFWSAVVCFVLYFGSTYHHLRGQIESCSLISPDSFSQEVQDSPDNKNTSRADAPSPASESCDAATPDEHTVNDNDSRFGTTLDATALLQGYLRDDSRHTTADTGTVTSLPDRYPRLPWYLGCQWVLYTAPAVSALPITVVFWSLMRPAGQSVVIENVLIHAMNSVTAFLELFITGLPVSLLHVVYPILYLLWYIVFSLIYVEAGGTDLWGNHYIYKVFDFEGNPSLTAGLVVAVVGLLLVSHVIVFFLSLLRDKILVCVSRR
ncbi:uncharacterized protein LOC118415501 [Branchiostoma floridae]|uniref:Uncharacterized protein LOC118415501 n=1 Tax=Branchiostoma floridae TaxID=7739 RepID=A0A9J7MRA7_BRAFL|nr:uncharacterized protein LOC118415501 [Branchiostoma floridae]